VCLIFGIREGEKEESADMLCCAGWIYVPWVGWPLGYRLEVFSREEVVRYCIVLCG